MKHTGDVVVEAHISWKLSAPPEGDVVCIMPDYPSYHYLQEKLGIHVYSCVGWKDYGQDLAPDIRHKEPVHQTLSDTKACKCTQ